MSTLKASSDDIRNTFNDEATEFQSDESRRNILFSFVLIAVIFTVPILILFYFMISFKTDNINFARKELIGLKYQAPLQSLLLDLISHKLLSVWNTEEKNVKVVAPEVKMVIGKSIVEVQEVDKKIGPTLEFTQQGLSIRNRAEFTANELEKKWGMLKSAEFRLSKSTLIESHDELIAHIKTMIIHLGDTSNLILDPDLDSYYLMDVTLLVIPQLQERLDNIAMLLLARKNSVNITLSERADFNTYLSLLRESDMARLKRSLEFAMREDPNFYGKSETLSAQLSPAIEILDAKLSRLENYLSDLSSGKISTIETDKAYLIINEALRGTGTFWNIAAEELKLLLENRVKSQISDRTRALYFTLIAWFLSLMTVVVVCRIVLRKQAALNEKIKSQGLAIVSSSKLSALGEMAGNIAHEVNTPIAAIKLNAEQLLEIINDEKPDLNMMRKMLEGVRDTCSRIGQIISGMKRYARDASDDPVKAENITKLIDETLVLCGESLTIRHIELKVEPFDKDLSIDCRSIEISQVLLNLIKNAMDAIEEFPEPWIKIAVQNFSNHVEISVTDCGSGIPSEIENKLFTPFFTTKPTGKGTGLGLGISKKIIEGHGGTLTVDYLSPNTKFVICLPKSQRLNSEQRKVA